MKTRENYGLSVLILRIIITFSLIGLIVSHYLNAPGISDKPTYPLWLIVVSLGYLNRLTLSDGITLSLDNLTDSITANLVRITLAGVGLLDWYFVGIMLIADLVMRLIINSSIKPVKAIIFLDSLFGQCILIALTLATGHKSPALIFILSAISSIILISGAVQVVIQSMSLRAPHLLSGTNGRIGIANWVSIIRMGLALVVPYIFASQPLGNYSNLWAMIVLAFAASTDFIDGYLARSRHEVTVIGETLDPICDKIIFYPVIFGLWIGNGFSLFSPFQNPFLIALAVIAITIIMTRDLLLLILAIIKLKSHNQKSMPARRFDKYRFVTLCAWMVTLALSLALQGLQFEGSPWLLETSFGIETGSLFGTLAYSFMIAAAVLSVVTIISGLRRVRSQDLLAH